MRHSSICSYTFATYIYPNCGSAYCIAFRNFFKKDSITRMIFVFCFCLKIIPDDYCNFQFITIQEIRLRKLINKKCLEVNIECAQISLFTTYQQNHPSTTVNNRRFSPLYFEIKYFRKFKPELVTLLIFLPQEIIVILFSKEKKRMTLHQGNHRFTAKYRRFTANYRHDVPQQKKIFVHASWTFSITHSMNYNL